jgi:predicted DNA-binding transcriptional regulator AlpA
MAPHDKLDEDEVCALAGIKKNTFRTYLSQGKAPKPDGKFGMARGGFWYRETVEKWIEKRETKGAGGVNLQAYDAAAWMIETGYWEVDPTLGTLRIQDHERYTLSGSGQGYLYAPIRWINNLGLNESGLVLVHRVIWEHRYFRPEVREDKREKRVVVGEDMVVRHSNGISVDNRLANLYESPRRSSDYFTRIREAGIRKQFGEELWEAHWAPGQE